MKLTAPTHEAVHYIARNLRAIDREEVYALRFHDNDFLLTNEVIACPLTWVAWHDGFPVAVLGAVEVTPGVWSMHCFGTDAFGRIALPLTRFAVKTFRPMLFGELGAHRLQADALAKNTESCRWIELLGGHKEAVLKGRGRKGEDFVTYAMMKPLDAQNAQV